MPRGSVPCLSASMVFLFVAVLLAIGPVPCAQAAGVHSGSVTVTIYPEDLRPYAAWRAGTGSWLASGQTAYNVPDGTMISYRDVTGWETPSSFSVEFLSDGGHIDTSDMYMSFTSGWIQVDIQPEAARTAGATWRLVQGDSVSNWFTSGNGVWAELTISCSIEFSDIPGWNKPGNLSFAIYTDGQMILKSGTYQPQVGSLRVTLEPQAARDAGAQWRVDGGAWQNSGNTVAQLPVGSHTVSFSTVAGWNTPGDQAVTIANNQVTNHTCTYNQQQGALRVTLEPAGARDDGAQWKVDTGAWQGSGVTASALPVGTHAVTFKPLAHWTTPANRNVSILENETTEVAVDYVHAPQIRLLPGPNWREIGQATTMTAVITGTTGNVSYQWTRNAADMPGQTEMTLDFSELALEDAGRYRCLITDGAGAYQTPPIDLFVFGPGSLPACGGLGIALTAIAILLAGARSPLLRHGRETTHRQH